MEEAEREAQKERPRKKALGLETKLAASKPAVEEAAKAKDPEKQRTTPSSFKVVHSLVERIPHQAHLLFQFRRMSFSSWGGPPSSSNLWRPRESSFTTSHATAHSEPRVLFERSSQLRAPTSMGDQKGSRRTAVQSSQSQKIERARS